MLVPRMAPFTSTIFAEMSPRALRTGDQLGRASRHRRLRFPARRSRCQRHPGVNHVPPGVGVRRCASRWRAPRSGSGARRRPDNVLITTGATEAIASAVLLAWRHRATRWSPSSLLDSYAATIALYGATLRRVTLRPVPGAGFTFDRRSCAPLLRPHPRGAGQHPAQPHRHRARPHAAHPDRRAGDRVDAVVVTDEVYEHMVYSDDATTEHVPMATLPGLVDRTSRSRRRARRFR